MEVDATESGRVTVEKWPGVCLVDAVACAPGADGLVAAGYAGVLALD